MSESKTAPMAAPQPQPGPRASRAILLITGIQAAGKSTVAQLLAERLPRSVHVRGDLFRRMVINGRADMTPSPPVRRCGSSGSATG